MGHGQVSSRRYSLSRLREGRAGQRRSGGKLGKGCGEEKAEKGEAG